MNWQKLATPPLFFVDGLAELQTDYHHGLISEYVFIGYLDIIFNAVMGEE